MLKIWGRRNSYNVQKVLWLVGELDLAHEHSDAGGSFGGLDTPEFRQRNPHGFIPVIEDEGLAVWESHTIIRYLAARYGSGSFWREDPGERSLADRWMDWSQASLGRAFVDLFWRFYRTPEVQRDWASIDEAKSRCFQGFEQLDRHLAQQDFLAGDSITMADIPAGTALYRYFELPLERPSMPNVEAWYRRLAERPAYRAHVMLPFADLHGRLAF